MRCRKVRSYLSAYSNGELTDRTRLAVVEHLSTCSACRKEEAIYKNINAARADVDKLTVTEDFNVQLLNRIARERFAETRTRAFLPKPAPRVSFSRVAPVMAAACVVILALATTFSPLRQADPNMAGPGGSSLDNAYLTAQPQDNPNMAVPMNREWSLSNEMARAERIARISTSLTAAGSFDRYVLSGNARRASSRVLDRAPYVPEYFKVRPVVRIYGAPQAAPVKEVIQVY
ncbi:MAG: zf-HC2 domain-containing protein [Candidatus Zixiibacteriota bacterium]|nr:MAG: zf-HC2 domain-containing protein [candidate division Zixibacteria bacterium]